MGGYQRYSWIKRRVPGDSKQTNLQNAITLDDDKKFNAAFPDRQLSNWEQYELRDYCAEKGLEYPPFAERTLDRFFRIVGRGPQYQRKNPATGVFETITPEMG